MIFERNFQLSQGTPLASQTIKGTLADAQSVFNDFTKTESKIFKKIISRAKKTRYHRWSDSEFVLTLKT
jgi:hypothetical protein